MKLNVSPLSGPISAGTSVASTRRELINSNCIITDVREQFPGLFTKDCLIQEYMNSCLMKMVHVAWRSGKVFCKADSLINLDRDAVKADVKKAAIHLYLGCHTTSCK